MALGGIGNKIKEWKNGMILSEVLKSVELCLDHLERKPVILSRKPAARLGEVIFTNKVSLGGLGAECSERIKNHTIRW